MNFTNTWTNCHEGLRNKTSHPEDFQDYATIFFMEKPLLGEPTPYSQFVNKTAHETVTDSIFHSHLTTLIFVAMCKFDSYLALFNKNYF